jgi:hypothetical protein
VAGIGYREARPVRVPVGHTGDCMCRVCISYRKALANPVPAEGGWHGTYGGYTNHGCRSECCLSAARKHRADYRRRKAMQQWQK